jgi:hypothetical protein
VVEFPPGLTPYSIGSKSNLKDSKNLLIGAFYMRHRNNKDMEELEKSLKIITEENNNNNII